MWSLVLRGRRWGLLTELERVETGALLSVVASFGDVRLIDNVLL